MKQKISAFADEFGNNSFDFENQGSHFIVATVICKNEDLDKLENDISEIRKKHGFQTGEMKSSGVAGNYKRRKNILIDVAKLNISIYAVIIDKRELTGQGFGFKKSFYKYCNNLVYKELFRTFPNLELFVDEHGGNSFMLEFKKYVQKQNQPNLFSGSEFNIVNSKNSYFIQLADFIAGTLGYIFDENKKSEFSPDFEKILEPITTSLNIFPQKYSYKNLLETNIDETFDPRIAEVCFLRIKDFIDNEIGTDQIKIDQINFLKLLLLFQRANAKNKYVKTAELFMHLNRSRNEKLAEEYFRSKVVGNLRDKGVLIASSREGYKIPTSIKDLEKFLNIGKSIIFPMLHRIKETRNIIKLATGNELDLLDKEEYKELKKLIEI
jgi:hypothetical protein